MLIATFFLSAVLGIALFWGTGTMRAIDSFLQTVGIAVYQMNRYGLDDHEHLALSQKHAVNILLRLLWLCMLVVLVVAVSLLPLLLISFEGVSAWDMGVAVAVVSAVLIAGYLVIRKKPRHDEYPPAKQLLYYATLGVPGTNWTIHRLENAVYGGEKKIDKALVVTGLARAGTTALLRELHDDPQFMSLTYRNMPFPMSGRLWRSVNRAKSEAKERSHQDGIFVDLDSPEAFDEYFWRLITKEKYYRENGLSWHEVSPQDIDAFESLVARHVRPDHVYLSKNNNFLLRAESVLQQRENYVLALVFREPVQHALSLKRQHNIHCAVQQRQPFVIDYMDMLGHHEFGLHRKDFLLPNSQLTRFDPADDNYWLERWIDYYRYALTLPSDSIHFIGNDQVRHHALLVIQKLRQSIGLEEPLSSPDVTSDVPITMAKQEEREHFDPELLLQSEEVLNQLRARTMSALSPL
ncbi:hypothetical protein Pan97_35410 [Bremerella volcania]|uniref:Sulfotransferase domain protein n=1 Tax=Bremerella volcania TaxID=2527984 RepID=A0A518CB86_9BACT|nr:hypothetical protein [Bremerella volcania]QDU76491.1 hypothetical protein Pan97_35410 [Bremerella volcania]